MRRTLPTLVLTLMVLACCPPCLAAVSAPEHPAVSGLVDGVDLTSPESLGWSREQAETARSYSRGSWLLGFIDPLIGIVSLALLSLTGFSGSLARRIGDSVTWRPASDSLFIVAMVAGL